ncbi:DegT/DnrJ/EryC1/StrS family aminotransferase [Acidovorax sp. NCPPB 4044]|uniref:DegT/DnrJ/EryC1/StrS family aminotransferase n=1 Tax=Acidovorax sp. NCPPB 4044 TaxID=2940490 RepID=UPI00230368DA|nr:DegT/DnrJ/EryC1/StrS family aminotransferase [Acidovorax sp. NCPPB 4044]MDA8519454.1 DegT/DnrJ/EryC1/StrS family aminotransferase [Acidovorax sp. NCPPB 4044]
MTAANSYPLASTTWDHEEYASLQEVITSGMFTMGPRVAAFEREFADYAGSKHAVMVSSGSAANLLMVAALFYRKQGTRLRRGDEVIVPAVSWSTTYYPLYQYGLKLKFVDIDRDTLNYDLEQLEAAITPATRLVMAVNLLGNPNDFDRISSLLEGRDIALIEDNCESMGAVFQGKQAGTIGLMGTFSSFFSHHISTMEGGLVVTDDDELHHLLVCLRAHGWTRNLPKFNHVCGEKSDDPFQESFRFVLPGYNVRPLEMSGALGSAQLRKLPGMVEVRQENARKFVALMADYPMLHVQKEIGQSSWFGFSMVLAENAPFDRRQLVAALEAHRIDCRPIVAGNFAKNEVMSWFDHEIHGQLRNADWIDQHGLFIGNHHYPLDAEFELLRGALDTLVR